MKNNIILPFFITVMIIFSSFTSFAGEWKLDASGWWYQNDDNTYPASKWEEINGKWYYFNEGGYMLSDATTPDGYTVSKSGEWLPSEESVNVKDSGKSYKFDKAGKWVSKGDIPEGEYVYYPSDSIKTSIIEGSSSLNSNFNYIKLYTDDMINPGTYVPVSDVGVLDITKEGVFLVGRDVKEGTYNLTPFKYDGSKLIISMCTVYNTIPSSKDQYSPEKNKNQDFYVGKVRGNSVTLKNGQYVQIFGCSTDFVRP